MQGQTFCTAESFAVGFADEFLTDWLSLCLAALPRRRLRHVFSRFFWALAVDGAIPPEAFEGA